MEYVITFKNTNYAIKSEQLILENHIKVSIMPLPSQIRAGCGICLRIDKDSIDSAESILRENSVEFETYKRNNNEYTKK